MPILVQNSAIPRIFTLKKFKKMDLKPFYALEPYGLARQEKAPLFLQAMLDLTHQHIASCAPYQKIIQKMALNLNNIQTIAQIPFIPTRLFKEFTLKSIADALIFKTLTSSGTSGQAVSKIYLDKASALNQQKTFVHIISSFIGKKRLPLLMLDTELVKKDRSMFSARGAGIIGFSTFGRDIHYALDEKMNIDVEKIAQFLDKHQDETILMFGYTYMIWQYIVKALKALNQKFNINNAILFHIGGWKKLKDEAVDTQTYNQNIQNVLGNVRVYNYYGMVEQLGSVFVECENGFMHCSNYSDILIRGAQDFSVLPNQQKGLIQLLSVLPHSYPGHSLLTEDEGVIVGEDDCPCGRLGKYFQIFGRIKNAELRGCSDTYEKP